MTADELLAMPHNGYRYELVQGELRQMEFADRQHGLIAAQIGGCLGAFVATNGLGETYAAGTGKMSFLRACLRHLGRRRNTSDTLFAGICSIIGDSKRWAVAKATTASTSRTPHSGFWRRRAASKTSLLEAVWRSPKR